MSNIPGIELVPRYIGTIMDMLELILLTLSISGLILLYIHKQKINKIIFYIFQFLLWFVMFISLWYLIVGIVLFFQKI